MNLAESFDDIIRKEKKVKNELHSIITDELAEGNESEDSRLSKLRGVHQLQKSIVKQNMHNAMSPISAISGYLELINISLSNKPDVKQIQHYRKQIEAGVNQVNVILEQLMEIYSDESDTVVTGREDLLDVDLNWVISEVCDQMRCAGPNVNFKRSANPLHVHTDVFMLKLITFNLISFALKCSGKDSVTEMSTRKKENKAVFSLVFEASDKKREELTQIMSGQENDGESDGYIQNSFNEGLMQSRKLAGQIQGDLDFKAVDDQTIRLNLRIPLSYSEN
jgi:K+-sensing histidine kinase KdpD